MQELLNPHVLMPLAVIIGSLSLVAMTLIIVLRDKISDVHVSRAGVEIRTNQSIPSLWDSGVDIPSNYKQDAFHL
jgi:hypothetical protein